MMRTIAAWLALCAAAVAQITVPAETEPHLPIVATVTAPIPDGARFDGTWKLEGAHFLPDGQNKIYIWAKPGEYRLEFSGLWLHLKDVTFTDGAGQEITITSYLGHGFVDESATFKVTGDTPDPDPDPDPQPGPSPIAADGLKVLIVRESGQPLTADQQVMLRSTVWMERVGPGNWMVVDPDQVFRVPNIWEDAMKATVNYGVPRIIVSNRPKGGVVQALPASLPELNKLIDDWAGD